MLRILLLPIYALILFGFLISSNLNAEDFQEDLSKPSILFVYPVDKGFPFWDSQLDFAEAVANAFDFELVIAYSPNSHRNRFDAATYIKDQLDTMKRQPSLVITSFWVGSEREILTLLNDRRIPLITVNSDLSGEQFVKLGRPREKFDLWLAHFSPNDTLAGQQLAFAIIEESRRLRCDSNACNVNIFAITGLSYSAVSKQRVRGLQIATREDLRVNLLSVIYGNWDRKLVESKAQPILQRHDDINAFWFASDVMAYGLQDGIESSKLALQANTVIGGIDWSPATIGKIKDGEMHVSLGGHFMEAGWGLILFYDYLHNVDLPISSTTVIKTKMGLLNKQNIDELGPFLTSPKWSKEQLKSYSRHLNPSRTGYSLDPKNIILDHIKANN